MGLPWHRNFRIHEKEDKNLVSSCKNFQLFLHLGSPLCLSCHVPSVLFQALFLWLQTILLAGQVCACIPILTWQEQYLYMWTNATARGLTLWWSLFHLWLQSWAVLHNPLWSISGLKKQNTVYRQNLWGSECCRSQDENVTYKEQRVENRHSIWEQTK